VWVRGHSRSFKTAPIDRTCTTSYQSATYELFNTEERRDVEITLSLTVTATSAH